jgi:hypothetical protein
MISVAKFKAQTLLRMVARSSRNASLLDKFCRWFVSRALARPAEDDFMRDALIDEDRGFDPDELAAYQSGSDRR